MNILSTKIYNGFYVDKMSLCEFQKFTERVREKMGNIARERLHKQLAMLSVRVIDTLITEDKRRAILHTRDIRDIESKKKFDEYDEKCEHSYPLLYLLYRRICDANNESRKTNIRNPGYDYTCNAVFFPLEDKTLCIVYAESDEYIDAFSGMAEVHEYGYWNNVDMPDDVSEDEWNQRERDWNIAFKKNDIPMLSGICVYFIEDISDLIYYDKLDRNKIVSQIPGAKTRANAIARHLVFEKKFQEYSDELRKTASDVEMHQYMDIYHKTEKYVKEHQKDVADKAEVVSRLIPQNIDVNSLSFSIDKLEIKYENQ